MDLAADPLEVVDLRAEVPAAPASELGAVRVGVSDGPVPPRALPLLTSLSCTLVGGVAAEALPPTCVASADLSADLSAVAAGVRAAPRAALTAAGLLPVTAVLPVADGLVVESAAYSMLLAGPEFAAWRASRPRRPLPAPDGPPVLLRRDGDLLRITLNRPGRHNAFDRTTRDALVEALDLPLLDPGVQVLLDGAGPSFCSGGDLDEFGTAPDVVTAHLVRLARSAGLAVHRCAPRVVARVHGACVGAGVEVPAFAGRVEARDGAWFQLPELRMGLVPGAGGTVSLPRRIGRWRTAYMLLSGQPVDVPTALAWGLVDARV